MQPMLLTAGFSAHGVFCSQPSPAWVMTLLRVQASSNYYLLPPDYRLSHFDKYICMCVRQTKYRHILTANSMLCIYMCMPWHCNKPTAKRRVRRWRRTASLVASAAVDRWLAQSNTLRSSPAVIGDADSIKMTPISAICTPPPRQMIASQSKSSKA